MTTKLFESLRALTAACKQEKWKIAEACAFEVTWLVLAERKASEAAQPLIAEIESSQKRSKLCQQQ